MAATTTTTAATTGAGALIALEGIGHTLRALLECLLVGLEEVHRLVGEGDDLGLETRELDALAEDDGVVDLVEGGAEFLVRDHAADDSGNLLVGELEHVGQGGDGEAVVEGGVGEEVCPQALLLNLRGQHLLDVVGLRHQIPDLDRAEHRRGLLPVTCSQELGAHDDTVTGVLGGTGEHLALVVVQHTAEGLGDDTALQFGRRRRLGHQRNFQEHAGGEVNALKKFQVDVHVEGQLALTLKTLLLRRHGGVTLENDTLGQQLLLPSATADLRKCVLSLIDETSAESTQTDLNKRAVEEDLCADVKVGNALSKVRHEHQVTRAVVLVVKGEVVDLAQHRACFDDTITVHIEVVAEGLNEASHITSLATRSDGRVQVGRKGLPSSFLQNRDNLRRLEVDVFQSPHDDSVHTVLPRIVLVGLRVALDVDLGAEKVSEQLLLITQTIDVFRSVGVNVLQRPGEFVIQSLDVRNDAARDVDSLARSRRGLSVIVIPFFRTLSNNISTVFLQDSQKSRKLLVCKLPLLGTHVVGGRGRGEVETGRDESQIHTDLLVRVLGNFQELLHGPDLLKAVGVLLTPRFDDDAEVLEDALRGVLQGLATTTNGSKAFVLIISHNGDHTLCLGRPGGSGSSRSRGSRTLRLGGLIPTLHKVILRCAVLLDQIGVFLVVLLYTLLNGVESLGVAGVHLLGGGLLFGNGLVHEILEIRNGLDIDLRGGTRLCDLDDLAVQFFEL